MPCARAGRSCSTRSAWRPAGWRRATASTRASTPSAGARSAPTTRPRTCCTRRCARCSARTCATPARPTPPAPPLLHAALREVLGPHVRQAGSLVAPDRLRFDFTHFEPVTEVEHDALEQIVNREIIRHLPVSTAELALEQALETGAMALFGEKYRDPVRVVAVEDFSRE